MARLWPAFKADATSGTTRSSPVSFPNCFPGKSCLSGDRGYTRLRTQPHQDTYVHWFHSLPFQQFQGLLTLFSKSTECANRPHAATSGPKPISSWPVVSSALMCKSNTPRRRANWSSQTWSSPSLGLCLSQQWFRQKRPMTCLLIVSAVWH
jgi:hypothetical protein